MTIHWKALGYATLGTAIAGYLMFALAIGLQGQKNNSEYERYKPSIGLVEDCGFTVTRYQDSWFDPYVYKISRGGIEGQFISANKMYVNSVGFVDLEAIAHDCGKGIENLATK